MPMGRPHGFRMGFGPLHPGAWAAMGLEPDQAVRAARLAYLTAWRNRLDAVIEKLEEELGEDCCCAGATEDEGAASASCCQGEGATEDPR